MAVVGKGDEIEVAAGGILLPECTVSGGGVGETV